MLSTRYMVAVAMAAGAALASGCGSSGNRLALPTSTASSNPPSGGQTATKTSPSGVASQAPGALSAEAQSTATGDIGFMVRHGETGMLVPKGDAQALADAVAGLWRDPESAVRMAREAHRNSARHTWPAVREQWADVYAAGLVIDEIAIATEPR